MSVSPLQEVTVGVADLQARRSQFESGLGLTTVSSGPVTATTAWRLFDLPSPNQAAVLGVDSFLGVPRIRLAEAPGFPPARPHGPGAPGPLGLGFVARGVPALCARLQRSDVRFLSAPATGDLAASSAAAHGGNLEAIGQTLDGDFLLLSEAAQPSAGPGGDGSEPRNVAFIVTNLDASLHFMRDVLEKDSDLLEAGSRSPFAALLAIGGDSRIRVALPRLSEGATGGVMFVEFEKRLTPPPQFSAFGRGVCRLRYDTTDLHETLARVPGGGGSLVRGPSGIDDPVLGRGLVALVRAPFGIVIELWQTA